MTQVSFFSTPIPQKKGEPHRSDSNLAIDEALSLIKEEKCKDEVQKILYITF